MYNTTQSVTNSKTYYPIYSSGGVNGNLNSPQVTNQIGTQIPVGTPQVTETLNQTSPIVTEPVITTTTSSGGGGKVFDTFDNAVR